MSQVITVEASCEMCSTVFKATGRVKSVEDILGMATNVHFFDSPGCRSTDGVISLIQPVDGDMGKGETNLSLLPHSHEEGIIEEKRIDEILAGIFSR